MPRTRKTIQIEDVEVPAAERLLTISEVSHILRVDPTTVRRWITNGALEAVILPHVNTRHAYRVKKEIIDGLTAPRKLEGSRA